jgi:hypothetical protein
MRGPPQNKYGGQQMQRMRGFKYSKPPSPTKGWSLSKPEIERIEAEMRAKGQLDPIPRKSR